VAPLLLLLLLLLQVAKAMWGQDKVISHSLPSPALRYFYPIATAAAAAGV
jgi:hypothetical protein